MTRSRLGRAIGAALVIGLASTALGASVVLAHPESEGDHPSGCVVTVEPGSVPVGGQFTVAGNFGGAEIYLVEGVDAAPVEAATPNATTPEGSSFSVTFTAEAGDVGQWTVWGILPESECADADALTVTTPSTATTEPSPLAAIGLILLALSGVAVARQAVVRR